MADVATNSQGKVATNGTLKPKTLSGSLTRNVFNRTRGRRKRVGRAEHGAASLNGVKTLPDHGNNGTRSHVLDEAREEGLAVKISVVYQNVRDQRSRTRVIR
jgi:hypothetical protein